MEENKKKISPKLSRKILILGLLILIIGIIVIVMGVKKYKADKNEYQKAYDEYRQNLFNSHEIGSISSPDMDNSGIFIIFGGAVVAFLSVPAIFIGATPYLTRTGTRLETETLEYISDDVAQLAKAGTGLKKKTLYAVGDDIKDIGTKSIDIAKPVIRKGVDEVVAPAINSIVKGFKGGTGKETNEVKQYCSKCGDEIETDEEYCSNCGTKLKKICPACKTTNSSKNKFCKKCGHEIQNN